MTVDQARHWLIKFSLAITAGHFVFFLGAPVMLRYPLRMNEAFRLVEIVIPVFLGYLGSATRFLFHRGGASADRQNVDPVLLRLLVKGPPLVFAFISASAVASFWWANRPTGPGMLPDTLGFIISANLGILTVTTNVVAANLFAVDGQKRKQTSRAERSC